jgi:hypothetical protein
MNLKPGSRLQSQACDTQVIVVRAPATDIDLQCGGHAMVAVGSAGERVALSADHSKATLMGKRYGNDTLELLCTKPGAGSLSIGDDPIDPKDAKLLPSSD